MTYSFDIFDTCFVRACGKPENVFDIIAKRIFGLNADENIIFDFSESRIEGEKLARENSKKEEITLIDIYSQSIFRTLTNLAPEELAQIEIDVEREMLIPVHEIKQKIESIHKNGQQVFFISDMYLPHEFIESLLKTHGFWSTGDKLYVSSTYFKTKATGNLYRLIAESNNLNFKDWIHYGDHPISDKKMPERLGIKPKQIRHKYTYYENLILDQQFFPDIFTNELLAGISKAVRLSLPANIHTTFASDLIGPVYIPFVLSILNDASKHGIDTLCFLARDGYIFYQIALRFSHLYPNINIKYIHVSRASLYFPGLNELTVESLLSIIKYDIKEQNIFKSLRKLIAPEVCDKIEQIELEINDSITIKDSCKALLDNKETNRILTNYHDSQRLLTLKYFIQEGMASRDKKTAIVDLRGSRSCQEAINNILSSNGYNKVRGYYFEVTKEHLPGGNYFSWYYENRYNGVSKLHLNGNVLEEYFCITDESRTIGYKEVDSIIQPVYSNTPSNENAQIKRLHNHVISYFCELYLKCGLQHNISETKCLAVMLISDFMTMPRYEYVKCLRHVRQRGKPLVNLLTPTVFFSHDYWWQIGSLIYTFRTSNSIKIAHYLQKFKHLITFRHPG